MWLVAKLVSEERDSFFCEDVAGVQVESLLRGVLLSADVSDVICLVDLSDDKKNLWC